jgi:hypothetical protein
VKDHKFEDDEKIFNDDKVEIHKSLVDNDAIDFIKN